MVMIGIYLGNTVAKAQEKITTVQPAKKDTIIPSQKDAISIMQSVCGTNNVRQEKGNFFCKICPSFTSYGADGGTDGVLNSVVYGAFTKVGVSEALVDLGNCESHVTLNGGSILLRYTNKGWFKVRYEPALRSYNCLKFPISKGRHSLVCENYYAGQGVEINGLSVLQVGLKATKINDLLTVVSNVHRCEPPFFEVKIRDFFKHDFNKDGHSDLIIKVSEATQTKISTRANNTQCHVANLPKPKLHQLIFLFDGQSFRPTSATMKLMNKLDKK